MSSLRVRTRSRAWAPFARAPWCEAEWLSWVPIAATSLRAQAPTRGWVRVARARESQPPGGCGQFAPRRFDGARTHSLWVARWLGGGRGGRVPLVKGWAGWELRPGRGRAPPPLPGSVPGAGCQSSRRGLPRERAAVVLLASGKGEFAQPQSLLYLNKMGSLPCLRHFFPPDAILYKHAFTCC